MLLKTILFSLPIILTNEARYRQFNMYFLLQIKVQLLAIFDQQVQNGYINDRDTLIEQLSVLLSPHMQLGFPCWSYY